MGNAAFAMLAEISQTLAAQIQEKCQLLGKDGTVQRGTVATESSLEDISLEKESTKTQSLAVTYGMLTSTNSILKEEIIK